MERGTKMTIEDGGNPLPAPEVQDRPGIVNHPGESAHPCREEDPPRGHEVQFLSL